MGCIGNYLSNFKRSDRYEIEHIYGLSMKALAFDKKFSSIIHPDYNARFKEVLKKVPCFDSKQWNLTNEADQYKELSGVYALTFNDKTFYIGETVNTFGKRYKQHIDSLYEGTHYNQRLQAAYDKIRSTNLIPIKIYILESEVCTEENKGCFKLMNLMREYYYQVLVLQSNFGLNNIQDTLKNLYLSPMFNYNYKMQDFRVMEDIFETMLRHMRPPESYGEINRFAKEFKSRLYSAQDCDFYRYILFNLKTTISEQK